MKKGYPFKILLIAVAIVAAVSFIPLNKLSGGKLKDFSLWSDIVKNDSDTLISAETYIDPDLEAAMAENLHLSTETSGGKSVPSANPYDSRKETSQPEPPLKVDIEVVSGEIEDYTPAGAGFVRLRQALNSASGKPARIAMLGDSYIEGDILSEVIREDLQEKFGGKGAGYIPVSSNIAGFRSSVRQNCSGWTEYDFRKNGKQMATLSGFYHSPKSGAKTTVKGSSKATHTSDWDNSRLLFISPDNSTITFSIGGEEPVSHEVAGSDKIQCISVPGNTGEVTLRCSDSNVKMFGIYLDGTSGIALDNMSVRGYAGIRHDNLNLELASQMRPYVDYSLIILEYGINALSADQKNYSHYAKLLGKTIDRIREAYPNADIMLMGIGDRGVRHGGEVISMPTVKNMIDAQRELAQEKGIFFFDTCAAMGGQGAVVDWASKKQINKDYIHLSRSGGTRLGHIISDAIVKKM